MSGTVAFDNNLVGPNPVEMAGVLGLHAAVADVRKVNGVLVDISAGDSEQIPLYSAAGLLVVGIELIWQEATDGAGAEVGDVTVGVTTGGAEVVVATAYAVSQATGQRQGLTILDGILEQGQSLFLSHDTVAEAGTYIPVIYYIGA